MSLQAQSWAYRTRPATATQKFVLVTLANYAGDHGACWPSLRRLAGDVQMAVNTVRARVDELVAQGLVHKTGRIRDDGSHSTNEYVLLMDADAIAYATEKGFVPPAGSAPDAAPPSGRRAKPTPAPDPRQLGLDLGEVTPPSSLPRDTTCTQDFSCVEGGGPIARTGVVQPVGPHEPSHEPSHEHPPKPPPGARGAEGDGVGSVDPTKVDAASPGDGPDLWPAFRKAYPADVLDRLVPAFAVWETLSAKERAAAVRFAPRYAAETQARGRKRVGMDRWLREKGWEPFVEAQAQRETAPQVWILADSPEAVAWAAHKGVRKLFTYESQHQPTRKRGCYQATRWPPGHPQGPDPPPVEAARSATSGGLP